MDNLISLKDVSFYPKGKKILDKISFNVRKSDFITIVGPNGAGKTSLLKIILGIEEGYKGGLEIKNDLKIGYVPQKLFINHTMPISVKVFLQLYDRKNNLDKILEELQLRKIYDLLDKQLHYLSGGELQKVLLIRSLLNEPEILVLDEPAQNLDIGAQVELYKLLDRLYSKRKIAILMVSHDLHLVMSSTRKVICLYHHICCEGEAHMVAKNPEFTKIFGDEMADIMSVYNHIHNHKH